MRTGARNQLILQSGTRPRCDNKMLVRTWLLCCLLTFAWAQDPILSIKETEPARYSDGKIRVQRGTDVTLSCTVENLPKGATVRWHKTALSPPNASPVKISKDKAVEDNMKFSIEKPTKYTWRLRLKADHVNDTGHYTCFVQTTLEVKIQETITVYVMVFPYLKEVSPDMTVQTGDRVELVCEAAGLPQPTVTWVRMGNQVLPIGKEIFKGPRLKWVNAKPEDRGRYRCKYENTIGMDYNDIELKVKFAPLVSVERAIVQQAVGYQIELQCFVDSDPYPTEMKWIKSGTSISSSSDRYRVRALRGAFNTLTYEMIFWAVEDDDFGEYTCQFRNNLGMSRNKIRLERAQTPQKSIKFGMVIAGARTPVAAVTSTVLALVTAAVVWL